MSVKLTKVIANFQTQLTAKLGVGGVAINIQSASDKNGVALPAGKYGFSINLGKSDEEHIVADLNGTALTNIESVSYQGVKTTGAAKEHRVGAVVKLTDFINFKVVVDMLSGAEPFDGSNPLSYDVEPTITDRKQFATAGYVQDVAAGAIGTADPIAAGTTRMTHDQGSKPRAMSTLVREQNTPDMTLLVGAFKHAEIDKNISFAGGNSPSFINPGLAGDLAIALNPSNGETFTLTINGTACVFTFVSSIGSTVGNVLIGASAAATRANLTAFINNPGATSATQVGFTGAQLTALGLVSATDDLSLNMFVKAISATVTTLTGAEAMAGTGNIWTTNTTKNRIDLLVLQTSDSTLQIRRGTEAVSPVAPTPTSGDIVLVHVYCKIGMTSVKDITDGTNGYIANWCFPNLFKTDFLFNTATPLIAGESLDGSATPVPVYLSKGLTPVINKIAQSNNGASSNCYGVNWFGQTFNTLGLLTAVSKIRLYTQKSGSPTGNITVSIYATAAGLPTGSPLQTKSLNVGLVNSGYTNFIFDTPADLLPNTVYALVVSVPSGTGSAYVILYRSATNLYAEGSYVASTNSGSSWAANTSYDLTFEIYGGIKIASGKIGKSLATSPVTSAVDGFVKSNLALNNGEVLNFAPVIGGFTGLTIGADYYLSDTGTISTTPGTNQILVGKAISTTEILLADKNRRIASGVIDLAVVGYTQSSPTVETISTIIGFKPRILILSGYVNAQRVSGTTNLTQAGSFKITDGIIESYITGASYSTTVLNATLLTVNNDTNTYTTLSTPASNFLTNDGFNLVATIRNDGNPVSNTINIGYIAIE